ncbi:Multiple antibiotic resistance protein MarA [Anaerohalosphaera lusitana]|uniref:Multiple antibiotic resistance protein MarA n=1 Tax=Anaerohalosphaera lusitana TaxID=1936003 RepID=A0A1U9NK87_9BACT|nr:AraC family transcriptional regulator [Anaerohalosphaera lusitana]AQT68158.1 Multiple antibiotic resistance protein MarA [Anaerohalosphaera lusitana]
MNIWNVKFQVIQPLASFPRPLCIEREVHSSPSYYNEGPFRQGEKHCFIKYTLSGRGELRDSSGTYSLTPGTCFLCDVRAPEFEYYYPENAAEPWEFFWMGFIGDTATKMVRELIARNGNIYNLPPDTTIIRKLLKYKNYNGLTCDLTPFDALKLVTEVISALTASCWSQHPDDARSILVRRTQQMITDNITGPVRISEIAHQLTVSREHLSRVFKEHIGMTLQEYILRQKMILACKLLRETTLSNKQIAARLGYDRPTHFTRAFKSLLHVTPSQFKEMGMTALL